MKPRNAEAIVKLTAIFVGLRVTVSAQTLHRIRIYFFFFNYAGLTRIIALTFPTFIRVLLEIFFFQDFNRINIINWNSAFLIEPFDMKINQIKKKN